MHSSLSSLRSDDETEVTVDESELSDSFSICSTSSWSSQHLKQRWLAARNINGAGNRLPFSLELNEEEESYNSLTSDTENLSSLDKATDKASASTKLPPHPLELDEDESYHLSSSEMDNMTCNHDNLSNIKAQEGCEEEGSYHLSSLELGLEMETESSACSVNHFSANIEDWDLVKIIGEGAFGQVFQVEQKNSCDGSHLDSKSYALKMLSKYQLVCDGQVDLVVTEKKLLQRASQHPFIVKLRAAWQDANLIYLLQDFVQGGELFSLMLQDGNAERDGSPPRKALPEHHVQFYAACIADALHYLHAKCNIVYRDLKPENALMDDRGYLMLIDLGGAKLLTEGENFRTYTLCGTPRYVAPEQISGGEHSFGVDHWALAVLVYEMLSSVHPFDQWESNDEFSLFNSIVDDYYPALPHFVSQEARDWVNKILVKDPKQRLGNCENGSDDRSELQQHPWLSCIDVAALRRRAVPAPWVPKLVDSHDSTHFDDWDHLDPVVRTHYPKLTGREAAMFYAFDDA